MCVILHMSVITQVGESALMDAARWGMTEVVVELVKAGANLNLQNIVCQNRGFVHDVHEHDISHSTVVLCILPWVVQHNSHT